MFCVNVFVRDQDASLLNYAARLLHGSDRSPDAQHHRRYPSEPQSRGLVSDSLVHRYPPNPRIDGLSGEEGTMCSFWLVEALTRAGLAYPERLDQARLLFERVLGYANHLGPYAEQTGPQGEALGNFP
jgi:GH15 family glucan-1,4-alpha-glucosidase